MSQTPRDPHRSPDDEEPLDPRLEAIAVKMRRLSLVSSGIMFLGIFAVLAVIMYRSLAAPSSEESAQSYPVPLPASDVRRLVVDAFPDAEIRSISVDARSVFVATVSSDGEAIIEIDRETWQLVSTVTFPR